MRIKSRKGKIQSNIDMTPMLESDVDASDETLLVVANDTDTEQGDDAEVAEEEKKKYNEKLQEVYAKNRKAMEKQREEMSRRQFSILTEQEGEYWDKISALEKQKNKLQKKLDKVTYDDYVLDSGGKQFSWGIVLLLILIVAGVIALLYYKPLLFGAGLIF